MKEMIQARKEQLQERGVSGFTLMEMLIVVAIIAVLVAIAIPVFASQLNNARAQADAANIRSGYATATVTVLTNDVKTDTTYYLNSNGTVQTTGEGSFKTQGASTEDIAGQSVTWTSDKTVSYAYTAADNTVKIVVATS
jgi:type IV pilus assembly protein PilA